MKKAFIILGNGFTIDFLKHYSEFEKSIFEKIDVRNLFGYGDKISTPWEDKPGFLSFKNCPALWTLGARPNSSPEESTALIEEIITCANMFFDFVNDAGQRKKRLNLETSSGDSLYLKAYSELTVYLQHLFSCYDKAISDEKLQEFITTYDSHWGWLNFFKSFPNKNYDKITFVTYNYDIWLERIFKVLGIDFCVEGFGSEDNTNIHIIKPHGSISFVPQNYVKTSYGVNYDLDFDGLILDQLELTYIDLTQYDKGAIIPPAGESQRLERTAPWSHSLRTKAKTFASEIAKDDEVVLCGISYWHVDRRELDELLINLDQDANFTFVNPHPPRDLNAVLSSIFKNYVQQSSSSEMGGILNGEDI